MSAAPATTELEEVIRSECRMAGKCGWMPLEPCKWKCDGHDLAIAVVTSIQQKEAAPAPGLEEAVERCAKIAEDLDGRGGGYGDYPSGWDAACSRIASDIRALTRGDGRELGAATRLDDEPTAPITDCNPKE